MLHANLIIKEKIGENMKKLMKKIVCLSLFVTMGFGLFAQTSKKVSSDDLKVVGGNITDQAILKYFPFYQSDFTSFCCRGRRYRNSDCYKSFWQNVRPI